MMTVIESAFILLDPLYTYLKPLSSKIVSNISMQLSINSVDNEWPIHHLIAIEEVTVQDES